MRWPKRISIGVGGLLALAPLTGTTLSSTRDSNHMIKIDLDNNPNLYFRIDNFSVPDAAREEFEAAMRRNLTFIRTLPGFLGHVVFEKRGGPTAFNIATIAVWENKRRSTKPACRWARTTRRSGSTRPRRWRDGESRPRLALSALPGSCSSSPARCGSGRSRGQATSETAVQRRHRSTNTPVGCRTQTASPRLAVTPKGRVESASKEAGEHRPTRRQDLPPNTFERD